MRELVSRFDTHDPTSAAVPGSVTESRGRVHPGYRHTASPRPPVLNGVLR